MKRSCKQGYSLLELLVSATIIALLTIAVVSMVRKSNHLTSEDAHRRRARALIDSCFESRSFHFSNYVNLAGDTLGVAIDERGAGSVEDDLTGTLTISVSGEMKMSGSDGIDVPYKEVGMLVRWLEPEGPVTINLTKWITQL